MKMLGPKLNFDARSWILDSRMSSSLRGKICLMNPERKLETESVFSRMKPVLVSSFMIDSGW